MILSYQQSDRRIAATDNVKNAVYLPDNRILTGDLFYFGELIHCQSKQIQY